MVGIAVFFKLGTRNVHHKRIKMRPLVRLHPVMTILKKRPNSFSDYLILAPVSLLAQRKIKIIAKKYCKDLYISLAFTSCKLSKMFSTKDPIPNALCSQVIYKFTWAGCHTYYVGETTKHFGTGVCEHLLSDRNSHIYKHLQGSESQFM